MKVNKIGVIDAGVETPEEIILAADLIPVRIFGDPNLSNKIVNEHIPSNHCVWSRNILELGLRGLSHDIKGIITTHGCDCTNRQFDIWLTYIDIGFKFFLNSPLKTDKIALRFFINDMSELIQQLEDYFKVSISDEKIKNKIILMNKIRLLLKKISQYRKKMILKGSDFHTLVKLVQTIEKNKAIKILEQKLMKLEIQEPIENSNLKKILLTGSVIDDSEFIRFLEKFNFQIVIDDLCVGTRYFWITVNEKGNPLEALANYHLQKPIYSTKVPSHNRYYFIENLAKKYKVDGVINVAQKFCESILYDHPFMKKNFKELGIPYLFIEKEYNRESYQQLVTRFAAFSELL